VTPRAARLVWTTIPVDADISGKNGWNPKHFWAFVVWNFDTKAIEILEISQSTIQTAMEELVNSEEWGDPLGYSITVNRKGENLETEYSVVPSPAQPTPEGILEACSSSSVAANQVYKYTNETTNLCMLTGVGEEFRPRKLVFESFESKPREGMGRQQEQAEGLRKKSKVFTPYAPAVLDASEIEPKAKWSARKCSYHSPSGPVAGVRFQLMLFDVSLELSRTFNHAVDHCLAIRPG
jgi:hypothetical protein